MGTVVALGFAAAVVYGTSDFLGGYAARSLPALRVTLLAFAAGTATSVLLLPLVASNWSRVAITYGAVAGAAAAGSIWLLYSALAIGPVSVVAPLVAVIAALVPVAYGLTHGERLGVPGETAIGAVVVSGALLAYDRAGGSHLTARALLTGIGAGVVTGAYLVALDLTPPSSGAAPVVVEFAVGTGVLGAAAALHHRSSRHAEPAGTRRQTGRRVPRRVAVVSGASQAVADVLIIIGIHHGDLAVMAALIALYPLGTITCARIMTNEHLAPLQATGVALAIAASITLAVTGKTA